EALLRVEGGFDALDLLGGDGVGAAARLDLGEPLVIDMLVFGEIAHELAKGVGDLGGGGFGRGVEIRFGHGLFSCWNTLAALRIASGRSVRGRYALTDSTRAPGSMGKVTMEISQRSASRMRRTPPVRRERTVRKPTDRPSRAPARISSSTSRARATPGASMPRTNRPRSSSRISSQRPIGSAGSCW